MEKRSRQAQLAFLERVRASVPANISFADELSELLGVSNDSVYRRLRGESLMSIDEVALICKHFKVAFETEVQKGAESVSFNYLQLDNSEAHFAKWLGTLNSEVKHIASVTENNILYAADDVPVWHHFGNTELACFKLFYWLKSILNVPAFSDRQFDPKFISEELIEATQELLANYNKTTSAEIWTEDTLNSTLKQIEYFWESGFFRSRDEALRMCAHIHELIDKLQQKAEKSSKLIGRGEPQTENFTLYMSEVMVGNNSILVTLGASRIAFVSINTFNMMSTSNPVFVDSSEAWLKNLVKKSVLISGVSEKQRNRFFNVLREKTELLKNKIR